MSIGPALFLLAVAWAIFRLQHFGSMDPHNLAATPSKLSIAARTAVTMIAIVALLSYRATYPEWLPFLCMFVLAQTIAVPFQSPDRMTVEEQPSAVQRGIIQLKSSVAGGVIAKFLAILAAWLVGSWWIYLVAAFGTMLSIGKLRLAYSLLNDQENEPRTGNRPSEKQLVTIGIWGVVTYMAVAGVFANDLVSTGGLDPTNWSGWAGLLAGAVASSLIAAWME